MPRLGKQEQEGIQCPLGPHELEDVSDCPAQLALGVAARDAAHMPD